MRGVVGQFAGLATLYADTLIYEGSGFDTQEPILVQEMGEETESRVVKLKCVKLVDPSQWTNTFPYFDVMVDYGIGDLQIRIDGNTNIWGTEPPIGTFGLTGIGGQSDGNAPFLDGYTLLPRSLDDLTEPVLSLFSVPDVFVLGGDGVCHQRKRERRLLPVVLRKWDLQQRGRPRVDLHRAWNVQHLLDGHG